LSFAVSQGSCDFQFLTGRRIWIVNPLPGDDNDGRKDWENRSRLVTGCRLQRKRAESSLSETGQRSSAAKPTIVAQLIEQAANATAK
jgi:hypothetical protein